MKQSTAPAVVLAIVMVFVLSRCFLATAQQPESVTPPAVSQPAFPNPSVTPGGGFPFPVQPQAPPVAGPKDPATASLTELVQQLKNLRQRKVELQRNEEKITAAIHQRIEQEKKLHEQVLQLLGAQEPDEPAIP